MPILFADDPTLFSTSDKRDLLVNKINTEIVHVFTWVRINKLLFNIDKTNIMLFSPNGVTHSMDCITIDGLKIEKVRQTKLLEVILDNTLNWHAHCKYICGKMSKGIGIIIKSCRASNEATLLSLYNSLILPYISHCTCIHLWGRAYDTHIKHVLVLPNNAIRVIAGVTPRTTPLTTPYRRPYLPARTHVLFWLSWELH